MQIIKYPEKEMWANFLTRPTAKLKEIEKRVKPILKKVKKKGDKALLSYALELDGAVLTDMLVSEAELAEAKKLVSKELKQAIGKAYKNIEKFHLAQRENFKPVSTMQGITCWRKSVPIQKVGFYIPGGTAPLFSTVLMLGIPAKIAGCEQIIMATPPNREGKVNPVILYTAQLVGVSKIVKSGGAQAVGALAYGTSVTPRVSKIFGPGNQYVTAAKQLVAKQGVAIDMPAGPSEVAILADSSANPAFVAADLLSQAEHGIDSQTILVTTDEDLIQKVAIELHQQLEKLPRKEMARISMANSRCFLVNNEDEAMDLLNEYAPEHLIIATETPQALAEKVVNAGSVFLGNYTPEAAGDYASGTNHTLPTNGFAKAYSGVSLDSFMKKITFQHITEQGIKNIGNVIETMAEAEQLTAHKEAVSIRLRYLDQYENKNQR
jgi:histidinol dehydrogenase